MSTSTRVTVAQYEDMIRRGLFEPREDHHVELLYGEVVPMSPIGPAHDNAVDELAEWSHRTAPTDAVRIRVQGSLSIPTLESIPEPDLLWLRRLDYSTRRPVPADVLLVIEVSDSSLAKDRGLKAGLYAEAGVADYWVVNLASRCVEVRRDPREGAYRSLETYRPGQDVRPLAVPGAVLPVARVFPE